MSIFLLHSVCHVLKMTLIRKACSFVEVIGCFYLYFILFCDSHLLVSSLLDEIKEFQRLISDAHWSIGSFSAPVIRSTIVEIICPSPTNMGSIIFYLTIGDSFDMNNLFRE